MKIPRDGPDKNRILSNPKLSNAGTASDIQGTVPDDTSAKLDDGREQMYAVIIRQRRKKDAPPINFQFSENDKKTLSALPAKDLLRILITDRDFDQFRYSPLYASLQNKSPEEILDAAAKFINDNQIEYSFAKQIGIISSPEFKSACDWIINNLHPAKDSLIHFKMFELFTQNTAFKKNIYIKALQTDDFKNFCVKIKQMYDIDASKDIIGSLNLYLERKNTGSPEKAQKVFDIIKKYFTDMQKSFLYSFDLRNFIGDEKNFEDKIKTCSKIANLYGARVLNGADLNEFFSADEDKINNLLSDEAKHNLKYLIGNGYCSNYGFNSYSEFSNKYNDILKNLAVFNVSIEELNNFLRLFSLNLSYLDLTSRAANRPLESINIKELTAPGEIDNFKNYITEMFKKYNADGNIFGNSSGCLNRVKILALNYAEYKKAENKERFFEKLSSMNNLWGQFARPENRQITITDINIKNYDLKSGVLSYLALPKFDKIVLDSNFKPPAETLKIIQDKIKTGTVDNLYQILTSRDSGWGLQHIELKVFLNILADNKENFYLDKKNIALRKAYNILGSKAEGAPPEIKNLKYLNFTQDCLPEIISKDYDFYANPAVMERVLKYFPSKTMTYNDAEGNLKKGVHIDFFVDLTEYGFLRGEEFAKLAETVEKKYSFANADVEKLIYCVYRGGGNLAIWNDGASKNETLERFNALLKTEACAKSSKAEILFMAMNPGNFTALNTLTELNFDIKNSDTLEYFFREISYQKPVIENLNNKEFVKFYNKAVNYFFDKANDTKFIPDISELFDYMKNKPGAQDLLFSETYTNALSYVTSKFGIKEIKCGILLPILKVAEFIDAQEYDAQKNKISAPAEKFDAFRQKLDKLLENLNERIYANDLMTLLAILENPGLEKIILSEDGQKTAVKELNAMYQKYPAREREQLDLPIMLKLKQSEDNEDETNTDMAEIKKMYTERPDLKELPKLQLLKLHMLMKSLDDPEFLNECARTVFGDINDTSTEHGGVTHYDGKRLQIQDIRSISRGDTIYTMPKFQDLHGGIFCFHCHSQKYASQYAGPAGFLVDYAGDLASTQQFHAPEMLMTNMGHPGGDKTKVTVNFDFYFIYNGKTYIIDLGCRELTRPRK